MGTKKQLVLQWLAHNHPAMVGLAEVLAIASTVPRVSQQYLRSVLRESGYPLHPLVEGVRQDSLKTVEDSLEALSMEYDKGHRDESRSLVLRAKDNAKLALKRDINLEIRKQKIDLMIRWLENPGAFPLWLRLRRRATETQPVPPE